MKYRDFKWKIDFWTIFFAIVSLVLFNLAVFFPEQRIVMLSFLAISIISGIFLFYLQKVNFNEKLIKGLYADIESLSKSIMERFNYMKELYNIKLEVEMLKKKKRGNFDLMDLFKVIIAIILIYVIVTTIKSLG